MNEMSVTTLIIRQRGDRLFTTSLDVAEKFVKRHAHVLSSIRKLCVDCAGFNEPKNRLVNEPKIGDVNRFASNFKETAYIDDKGEQRPMFEMTRAGFSVLAMGFTGKKALEDGMREQLFYKDIYQLAKQRIKFFAVAIPRSNVIAIQASLPGRLHQLEAIA